MNFYHRFICNFSSVAVQLTALLKGKPNLLCWNKEADRTFNDLKVKFTIASVLRLPDLEKPFVLKVNASETGVEEVLSHEAVRGQTELQCEQQRTSSSEVVWRHWLEGDQFFFYSPHRPQKCYARLGKPGDLFSPQDSTHLSHTDLTLKISKQTPFLACSSQRKSSLLMSPQPLHCSRQSLGTFHHLDLHLCCTPQCSRHAAVTHQAV